MPIDVTSRGAFHFATLTPDLILDALASCGFYLDSGLTPLNSYENRVYQFIAEDRQRYVVKFYRPERWSAEQLREEHELAEFLAAQDVNVAVPLSIRGATLHHFHGFNFAVWPSLGGRHLEPDNLDQLEAVGHQLGLWHSCSHQYQLKYRPRISASYSLALPCNELSRLSPWPRAMAGEFAEILQLLTQAVTPCFEQPVAMFPLHGDCHIGNILWRDKPLLVDLDDCVTGPAIQDLWMLLSGDDAEQRMQLDALLAGYEEFAVFDIAQLRLIEPLRTMRMVSHMAWLAKRWEDPAFPTAFPWYATEEYWLGQAKSLRQQLEKLKQPPLVLTPAY